MTKRDEKPGLLVWMQGMPKRENGKKQKHTAACVFLAFFQHELDYQEQKVKSLLTRERELVEAVEDAFENTFCTERKGRR